MKAQAIVTVLRDLGCIAVGVYGVLHQEVTGHVNGELLAVYTTLLGVPGAIGLAQLLLGRAVTGPGGTTESSSSSLSGSSSSQSPGSPSRSA